MSEKDILIRKLWIVSSTVLLIGNLFLAYAQNPNFFGGKILSFLYCAVIALSSIYIYYRCAFRKPGIKLLTYMLYTMPIFLVFSMIQVSVGNLPFLLSCLHPLQLIPMIWIYILSWQLKKINKKLQAS